MNIKTIDFAESPVLIYTPFLKGHPAAFAHYAVERAGTSFGLNDLEALVSVACGSKEWISIHALKR